MLKKTDVEAMVQVSVGKQMRGVKGRGKEGGGRRVKRKEKKKVSDSNLKTAWYSYINADATLNCVI